MDFLTSIMWAFAVGLFVVAILVYLKDYDAEEEEEVERRTGSTKKRKKR
jgi:uncharacterized membrane protein